MKTMLTALTLLLIGSLSWAGHHEEGLKLEKRQPTSTLTVTSVDFYDDYTVISATGDVGLYGKVYATYHLNYGADRTSGSVSGQGRGISGGNVLSGHLNGRWIREGSSVVMHNVTQISDGTMNLDVITFDAVGNELTLDVYTLK